MTIPRTVDDLTPEWCSDALGRTITTVHADAARCRRRPGRPALQARARRSRRRVDRGREARGARPTRAASSRPCSTCTAARSASTPSSRRARRSGIRCVTTPSTIPRRRTPCCCSKTCRRAVACSTRSPGCSVADARPAIRSLAKLHACFWDDASLDDAPLSAAARATTRIPGAVAFAYDTAWPRVQEFFPELITDARCKAFGDAYAAQIPALFEKLCEPPLVLAHGDWRLDNLFFTPDDDVIAVDWQLIDRSVGPRDLAYLVTESVNVADPARATRPRSRPTSATSPTHGVHPDEEWAFEMYRYGTMLGFVYPVIAAGALTIDDPRHLELHRRDARAAASTRSEALDAFDLPL